MCTSALPFKTVVIPSTIALSIPGLYFSRLISVALYYYLVVTNEDRHGSRTLVFALRQKCQREL